MVQQLIVGSIVLLAGAFIVRRMVRAVQAARAPKGGGCDSGCGCVTPPAH
jgi:FeoB-associated Cys-rich membrane protein